jgi:hypothetical protein
MKVWLMLFIVCISPAFGQSLPPSGGTMTGPLVLSGNPLPPETPMQVVGSIPIY